MEETVLDVKQIFLSRMANFAYLVGDEATRTAAVIDPSFEPERILAEATSAGFSITHVINTHGHADHVSGHAGLIEKTHASLLIHEADAEQVNRFLSRALSRLLGGKGSPAATRLLSDEDTIEIGESQLSVIHTPGHTPGSICLYAPGHLFTGDTLFVGAVGRTDLPGGSMRQLLSSVRERLYALPEETRVWPGHDYGEAPFSTIGQEKASNPFT